MDVKELKTETSFIFFLKIKKKKKKSIKMLSASTIPQMFAAEMREVSRPAQTQQ